MNFNSCYDRVLYYIFGYKKYIIREEETQNTILEITLLGNKIENIKVGDKFVIGRRQEEEIVIKDEEEKKCD